MLAGYLFSCRLSLGAVREWGVPQSNDWQHSSPPATRHRIVRIMSLVYGTLNIDVGLFVSCRWYIAR